MAQIRKEPFSESRERLEGKAEHTQLPSLARVLSSLRKVQLYPVLGLLFIAGWIRLSAANGNLLMDKILVAAFIVACIFFLKALDTTGHDKQHEI